MDNEKKNDNIGNANETSDSLKEKKEKKSLLSGMKMKKTEEKQTQTPENRDDAIFRDLSDKKKKKKKRLIITIIIVAVLVLALLIFGVFFLRRRVNRMSLDIGDVVSAEATKGSISTTVSGYGSLSNSNEETITVPANVTVEEVLVSANDALKEGDIIATVNAASVKNALSTVQDELDDLDDDISEASSKYANSYISTGVAGRMKKLYAKSGDEISQVMYDNGAVALLSIDGYMAFDVTTDKVSAGQSVKVVRADENKTQITGTVETVTLGTATVLVKDSQADYGETLTLLDENAEELGEGEAYIHNQIKITGTQGKVSYLSANEGSYLYAGTVICYLSDVSQTGTYSTLLEQRQEKEEELNSLIKIYQDGALTAPYDGRIASVDYDETAVVEGEETDVCTFTDDTKMEVTINVDEANILSLEIGQSATVTVSSIGDDEFDAVLTEINKTATSSSGVTKYTATVSMDKSEQMISGMTATVVIRIQGVDNAIIIPVEALHQTSSTSYVYTSYDEETGEFGGRVDVEVGIQNSSYVEITSGLKEGDTVYYTETENSAFASMMGGFPDGGDFPSGDFSGGDFPGGGPSGGGFSGGGPSGGMPSGGFPGGSR